MLVEKDKFKPKNNTSIKQAWMTKVLEKSLRLKAILKYLKLYCSHSSINSLKYLVDFQRPWFERNFKINGGSYKLKRLQITILFRGILCEKEKRQTRHIFQKGEKKGKRKKYNSTKCVLEIMWVIIHCIIISVLVSMVYTSYQEFESKPLVTSMDANDIETTKILFPGIAICSINRISLQSAKELATNISNAKITDRSVDEILNLIMQLGNLYVSMMVCTDNSNDVELDKLLTTYYNGSYDVTQIMKTLTPQCSTMLLKCMLHRIDRNCSELFEFRRTQDGYCCTFNYVRENDDIPDSNSDRITKLYSNRLNNIIELTRNQERVETLGIGSGLSVIMDPLLDDNFCSILPFSGWKVTVFNPTDYPDMTSGGVTEVFALPQVETYVNVVATLFSSSQTIINLPRNKLIVSSIVRLMTYRSSVDVDRSFTHVVARKNVNSWRICGITDFQCLTKYKSKRLTIFPHEDDDTIFYEEGDNTLHCLHCYPACNDTNYDVLSWRDHINDGSFDPNLFPNYKITNEGVLHIYFSEYGTIKLTQDVSSYWYNLLSDIGGLCGVFIGFSFITIVELLYFFVLLFCDLFCKKSALQKDDRKTEIPPDQTETTGELYWNEMLPQSWHSAKYGRSSTKKARY
ncbi:Sodium channel protein Nach [Trachymyrmex cornetzi]|uniref:Sodium channel protein Nach n=1 Tax=Trachymyrmex cornetzi TaxID=471704 RepID=A0A195EF39_9HYME|nr:Sodium channel protein Nach [Trachymyrmex cornetzi]